MRAFKIYNSDDMGYNYEEEYCTSYNTAIQIFNNKIRKTRAGLTGDLVSDKEEFGEAVINTRLALKETLAIKGDKGEIICRKNPLIIVRIGNRLIALLFYWSLVGYEYSEYDMSSADIILEEIELQ